MIRLAHHHRCVQSSSDDGERGAILIFVAITLIAVLLVATVVIDGSQAYSQRRSMQNAADASALAGARALDKVRYGGAAWGTVSTTVEDLASNNKAEATTCLIIDGYGGVIGSCSSGPAVTAANAAGVRVTATDIRATTFGQLSGRTTVKAVATAAATIQTLTGTASPFIICGNSAKGGYPILNPDGSINATTASRMGTIVVESSQVPSCGSGDAFKGKNNQVGAVTVPSWISGDNGNGYEQEIENDVVGATPCPSGGPFKDCDMLIPIADDGRANGTSIQMHIVAWAVFHITGEGSGNPKYYGTFRADVGIVTGGSSSTALPATAGTPRMIRLIQ